MLKMTMRDQLFSFFTDSMDLRKSQVARLRRLYVDGDSIRLVAEEEGLTKQAIYLSMERFERQMSEVLEERGLILELALSPLDGDEARYLMHDASKHD